MRNLLRVALLLLAAAVSRASITSQTDQSPPYTVLGLPSTVPVPFPFQLGSDLVAYDLGSVGTPRVPAKLLVLGSDYTVTGGGYNSAVQMQVGSIQVVTTGLGAIIPNDQIVIMRGVPINQITSFSSTGPLTISLIEQALDKQSTLSQQVNQAAASALHFEPQESLNTVLSKAARASMGLGFDATGNVSFFPTSSFVAPGDVSSSLVTSTGSTTARTLATRFAVVANVKDYGAQGDGVSNDTSAVLAAYNALKARSPASGQLFFPPGTYLFNLTVNAGDNISVMGVPGATKFTPVAHSAVFTISGFATVESKIYFKNFGVVGTGNTAEQAFNINLSSIVVENVQVTNVGTCVYIAQALGCDFVRSRFYGINYGFVEIGSPSEYSGFNIFDDVEIQAGKCGIYKDNTAGGGNGGGDLYIKVLFEGIQGIFFYGNSSAEYASPDFFGYIWLEGIATATTLNLSDVGGPASLTVNNTGLFFVNSSATCDWITYPFAATNKSNIRVRHYNTENGQAWTTDATSTALVDLVTTGSGGLAIPYATKNLEPNNVGITVIGTSVRDSFDYSQINLLGGTGDGCQNIAGAGGAGTSAAIVEDDTAPVFNKVAQYTIPAGGNYTIYPWTTTTAASPNQVQGDWYVYSYYINVSAGNGRIGPDWINILPTESNFTLNTWYHVQGIYACPSSNTVRDMLLRNFGSVPATFELSQFQVVQFTDGKLAQEFLNSNRYAAAYPGGTPRYNLVAFRLRTMLGTNAPSANALFVGQQFIDTTHNKVYEATTTGTGAGDWVALN